MAATPTRTLEVVLVSSPGCHLCTDARGFLEDLAGDFPLELRLVEASSPEGHALIERHRPPLRPLVILEGEAFSAGRLPRKKLRRALERLQGS